MKKDKRIILGLVALVFFLGVLGSLLQTEPNAKADNITEKLGGDFELQGVDGPVKLSDFSGKAILLFFGYTNCPDVCPVTLANISRALEKITPEKVNQAKMLFVSLDPQRDTVEHLNNYVQFFNKNFIGLTGEKEALDKVARQYGAVYRIVEMGNSAMSYSVDHSTKLYLIDKNGKVAHYLRYDSSPEEIAAKINAVL